jgi:glycosidase
MSKRSPSILPLLLEGSYIALNQDDANVMSYMRSYKGKAVLVALNMSGTAQKATFKGTARVRKGEHENADCFARSVD